jgi:hypothetical protein
MVIFSTIRTKEEARGRRNALWAEGENGVQRQRAETAMVMVLSLPLGQLYIGTDGATKVRVTNGQTVVVSNPARTRAMNGRLTGRTSRRIK